MRSRRKGKQSAEAKTTDKQESITRTPEINEMQAGLMSAVGLVKPSRIYDVDNNFMSPPVIFRRVIPWAALRAGFRPYANDETDDVGINLLNYDPVGVNGSSDFNNPSKATTDATTYEVTTPLASVFVSQVWPVYDRLFRSGIKQAGSDVSFNSFVACIIQLTQAHSYILDCITYLKWSEGVGVRDWDDLSGNFSDCFQLHSTSFRRRLENAMNQISGLPCIKGIVHETVRMKSPFMPLGGDGTIVQPVELMPADNITVARTAPTSVIINFVNSVESALTNVRTQYPDELAAMKRHMPYTYGDCNAFSLLPLAADPFKTDGFNMSAFEALNVAGNEGDESDVTSIILNEDALGTGFLPGVFTQDTTSALLKDRLHTVFPSELPLMSILSGSVWVHDNDVIDKAFALLTPHIVERPQIPYWSTSLDSFRFLAFAGGDIPDNRTHLTRALGRHTYGHSGDTIYAPFANPTDRKSVV